MKLSGKGYKAVKIIHILSSSIWIGACAIGLFLLLVVLNKNNLMESLSALHYIDLLTIILANLVTFITGVIFSKRTSWSFFKHRWITLKYAINLIPIVGGGLIFAPAIVNMLSAVEELGGEALLDSSFIFWKNIFTGAFVAMLLLLATAVFFAVVKPKLGKACFA
jgi:hypothetical protein